MKTFPPLIRNLAAAAAVLHRCGSAFAADLPTQPILTVPVVSVFHRPYLPYTGGLKAALIASKGDREESQLTLVVSDFSHWTQVKYFSLYTASQSDAYYDRRTGEFSYVSTTTSVDGDHPPKKSTTFAPFGYTAESRAFRCRALEGNWDQADEVKSKCMIVHKVTHRAVSPLVHMWNPINIMTVFATTPLPNDCTPVTRKRRTLSHPETFLSGDWREFDVQTVGFSNEFCESLGDWSLFVNQSSNDK